MKTISPYFFALVLAAPLTALAQSPGSVGTITVSLTVSYTAPGTVAKDSETGKPLSLADGGGPAYENEWMIVRENKDGDVTSDESRSEYVSKVAVFKYSNKQIIEELVATEFLPAIGKAPHLAGWSLIQATDGEGSESVLYARHTNGTSVELGEYLKIIADPAAEARTENYQYAQKNTYNLADPDKDKSSETESHSIAYKTPIDLNLGEGWISATGLYSSGAKLSAIAVKFDGVTEKIPVTVPTASKVTNIAGSVELFMESANAEEPTETTGVVEGSVNISAGKVLADLDTYLNPQ